MPYRPETFIGGAKTRPLIEEGISEIDRVRGEAEEMILRGDPSIDPSHTYFIVGVNRTDGEEYYLCGSSIDPSDARAQVAMLAEQDEDSGDHANFPNLTNYHILRIDELRFAGKSQDK